MKQIAALAGTIGFFLAGCAASTVPHAPAQHMPLDGPTATAAEQPRSDHPMLAPVQRHTPHYLTKADPSGAPMCFDHQGRKALLVHCVASSTHVLLLDPTGAPMCFDQHGNKAGLDSCAASAAYVSQVDPSGARVCFHRSGEKAPLDQCAGDTSAANLVATAF